MASDPPRGDKVCFVTVGTTSFDNLVAQFDDVRVHTALRGLGIDRVVVQKGRGGHTPNTSPDSDEPYLPLQVFDFAPNLDRYMQEASLVISHGGAGTIMEALTLRKPLIVVVNDALMDNHQTELAEALEARNYLIGTTPQGLLETLQRSSGRIHRFDAYPQADTAAFPGVVDEMCGVAR